MKKTTELGLCIRHEHQIVTDSILQRIPSYDLHRTTTPSEAVGPEWAALAFLSYTPSAVRSTYPNIARLINDGTDTHNEH